VDCYDDARSRIFATYSRVYPVRRATSEIDRRSGSTAARMASCSSWRRSFMTCSARRNRVVAASSSASSGVRGVSRDGMPLSVAQPIQRNNHANWVHSRVLN